MTCRVSIAVLLAAAIGVTGAWSGEPEGAHHAHFVVTHFDATTAPKDGVLLIDDVSITKN